jgi:hypothetical protein
MCNEAEKTPGGGLRFTMVSSSVIPGVPRPLAEQLPGWFTYHPPQAGQPGRYEAIRAEGRELAGMLTELCPPGVELDQALLRLRETVMWANAAIACNAEQPPQGTDSPQPMRGSIAARLTGAAAGGGTP